MQTEAQATANRQLLWGNTYPLTAEIIAAGGQWDNHYKAWSLPAEAFYDLMPKVPPMPKKYAIGKCWNCGLKLGRYEMRFGQCKQCLRIKSGK